VLKSNLRKNSGNIFKVNIRDMYENIFQRIYLKLASCIVALKTFYLVFQVSILILKIKNNVS